MMSVIIEVSCFMSMSSEGMNVIIDSDNIEKLSAVAKRSKSVILACGNPGENFLLYKMAFKYAKELFDFKSCKVSGEVIERTTENNLFTYPNPGMLELAFLHMSLPKYEIAFIGCKNAHRQAASNAGCHYIDVSEIS